MVEWNCELTETSMGKRRMRNEHIYNEYCFPLRELKISDSLQIQYQDGLYTIGGYKQEESRRYSVTSSTMFGWMEEIG